MNTKNLLLLICGTTLFISCKKEEKEAQSPTPKTTTEMIQAKWKVDKVVSYYYWDPMDWSMDSTNGTAADYFDFHSDGRVYTSIAGETDTASYTIRNSWGLFINNDFYAINSLNDSALALSINYEPPSPKVGDLVAKKFQLKK